MKQTFSLKNQIDVALAWKNVNFEVREWSGLKAKKKVILRQLTGSFQVGTLNGLLGPSGAGKTSLLNCLSGSVTSGLSDGALLYSSEATPRSYFIAQHVTESIVGELTIRQILEYAYRFKNGNGDSSENMRKYLASILQDLLLDESILDRPFSVCSGGEQKRIAIAQELMSRQAPTFLFLDEPTTGLDSAAALEVMTSLGKLAHSQSLTIIASIHAPNSETLALFDQLYILAHGGVCIFSGPPHTIRPWLQTTLELSIPENQPPIEVLIKLACTGIQNPDVLKLANQILEQSSIPTTNLVALPHGLPNTRKSFHLSDFFLQLSRLFRITFLAKYRSIILSLLLFFIYISLLSTMFDASMTRVSGCTPINQSSTETAESCLANVADQNFIKENVFFLCNVLIYTGVVTLCTSAAVFTSTIKVFRSEHRNRWYSLGVFYWSWTVVCFLEVSIYALLNASLGYFLPSQHAIDGYSLNVNRFTHYVFFMWLLTFYLQSIGQLIGLILVNHVDLAIVLCVIFHTGASMINGLFVDTEGRGNVYLMESSSLVGFKFISWGMLYTFYAIDRCDWQSEFSLVVQAFHFDIDAIGMYVFRIFANILVVRLFTIFIMFAKFGTTNARKQKRSKNLPKEPIMIIEHLNSHENPTFVCETEKVSVREAPSLAQNTIILAWRNLSLFTESSLFETSIRDGAKGKPILQNLNGQFHFGTLNALMGTSGAGKTSLLKVLNGRCKTRLSDETEVYLSKHSKISTCFIAQDVSGHLMDGLTARQMLIYASKLKNTQGSVDHEQIAIKWLSELDLLATLDTRVEKCSGGERKRLAVALELTDLVIPNCVCIDEPTSGLDSNSAETVMSVLFKLTKHHPMTIITSLHQPTREILNHLDQLYVLARGGVCIYSGPPSGISTHLKSISQSPSQYPIDCLIKHSCSAHTDPIVQALIHLTNSHYSPSTHPALTSQTQLIPDGIQRNRIRFSLHSVRLLFSRYLLYFRQHLWKEHLFFSLNYLFYGFAIPLFYDDTMVQQTGCIDLQADFNVFCSTNQTVLKSTYDLLDNFKYTFFVNNFFLIFLLIQLSLSFLRELVLFENEHRNGWYSSGSFYLTKSFFELLLLLPILALYVFIINWWETVVPGIYWSLLLLFILSALAFQGQSHVFALLSRGNVALLIVQSITVFLFSLMLSNFFLLYPRLHYVYQFLSNFAIGRFFFEGTMLLQYGFGRCSAGDIQFTLYSMALTDDDYARCVRMLIFNILFYRGLAIYLLLSKMNPPENRRKRGARIEQFRRDLKSDLPFFKS